MLELDQCPIAVVALIRYDLRETFGVKLVVFPLLRHRVELLLRLFQRLADRTRVAFIPPPGPSPPQSRPYPRRLRAPPCGPSASARPPSPSSPLPGPRGFSSRLWTLS